MINFKQYVKQDMSSAHYSKHIKLKDKCKDFTLNKKIEMRLRWNESERCI